MQQNIKKESTIKKTRQHDERCRVCKVNLKHMFTALFSNVESNCNLQLPSRLVDYSNTSVFESLTVIHDALQKHRGFDEFVKSKSLSPVDFYIPSRKLILEFDETQHFTKPREIALELYPKNNSFGYSTNRWRSLCQDLNKRDNSPPFRDEQRAWYDVLRDFAPLVNGEGQTIRLYAKDYVWCSLDPKSKSDIDIFEQLVFKN